MYEQPTRNLPSSNAGIILLIGILSVVGLFFLGPVAWMLGNRAIRNINGGMADPAERGMANAGRICGAVGTLLLVLIVCFWTAFAVLMARYGANAIKQESALALQPGPVTVTPPAEQLQSTIDLDDMKALDQLLAAHPSLVNNKNEEGDTPLFGVAFMGQIDAAKVLLAHGAKVNAKNRLGQTPLDRAREGLRNDMVSFLKAHGGVRGSGDG